MVIISIMVFVMVIGYMLLYLTYVIPIFRLMYMDWIAAIVISIPTIMMCIRLGTSKSTKLFEKKPVGKELVLFLRRDGTVDPIYMKRPFKGMSFLDCPGYGIIHDLGKGAVYRWGDKNIRFALENVAHTPIPKYANFTSQLNQWGFNNKQDVMSLFDNSFGSRVVDSLPRFDVVDKAVSDIKEFVPDDTIFKTSYDKERSKIDEVISKISIPVKRQRVNDEVIKDKIRGLKR